MKYLIRLSGFLIDAAVSFFICQIVSLIVAYFVFIPLLGGFFFTWVGYYIVCYLVWKKTLGQTIVSYGISDFGNGSSYPVRILLRECFTSFPAVVILTLGWGHVSVFRTLLLSLLCCILTIFRKRLFRIAVIKNENQSSVSRRAVRIYLSLLVAALFARAVNTVATCNHAAADSSVLYATPRPSANSVRDYTDFLKNSRQNINDYVIGLFDRYDHVILCERAHREMTQYDMIYSLVTDSRFVDRVGHVFTEIGNVESRDAYKTLADTDFADDSAVDSCLGAFMMENQSVHLLWPNTNWFEFLKKMYYFNNRHDKKVGILFADRNWTDKSEIDFRDSIMADNIINTIQSDSIGKSLIIMNYRHAYLTPGNCGYYVERSFPGKVANVMINTGKANLPALLAGMETITPVQDGKWDVAFEQMTDSCFAFDFRSSPFGDDRFDHFILPWSPVASRKYEDMFTGFIFYNSLDNHMMSIGYPHILDSGNLRRLRHRQEEMKEYSLDYWIETLKDGVKRQTGTDFYYKLNMIENIAISGVFIFGIFLSIISLLLCRRNSKTA